MRLNVINVAARLSAVLCICFALVGPAAASHLVTGNGHGFGVVAPELGVATKFYPHPHSFTRPDPANALGEGIETANFIKSLGLGTNGQSSADYVDDSQVIRLRCGKRTGTFFMPFGLERPALIIVANAPAWRVEWTRPLRSSKMLSGGARVLRFQGIDEPLLVIPLSAVRHSSAASLMGSA